MSAIVITCQVVDWYKNRLEGLIINSIISRTGVASTYEMNVKLFPFMQLNVLLYAEQWLQYVLFMLKGDDYPSHWDG